MPISDPAVTAASGESTSLTFTTPTHADGDLLLVWVEFAGGTGVTITPPAGWNLVDRQDYLDQLSLATYQKVAASEPANQTWTLSTSQKWTGGIAAYPGAGSIAVGDGRVDQYGVRRFAVPAIITTEPDTRVVAIAAQGSPSTYTVPADWTIRGQERSGSSNKGDLSSALIDKTQATPGSVPSTTLTAAVGTSALVVSRSNGSTRTTDPSVKPQDALTNLGFTDVLIVDHRTAAATMLQESDNRDVAIILGEVSSGNVGTKLNASTTGVFNLEIGLFSTLLAASNFVEGAVGGSLRIDIPTHPVANGLSGAVAIATEDRFYYGAPPTAPDAVLIASIPDEPATNSTWFAIEKGGELTDATQAPARQVHCGVHENTGGWTDDCLTLLESSIDFCARNGPSPQIVVMLALTESAIAVNESTGSGTITLPVMDVSGEGAAINAVGSGAITLPIPQIRGEGVANLAAGTGAVTLPSLGVSSEGAASAPAADEVVGTGSISLSSLIVSGTGSVVSPQDIQGTGNITLPTATAKGQGRGITLQPTQVTRTPASRTLVVAREKRTLVIAKEKRTFEIKPLASLRSGW